ncbi:MAG: hypothetical protein LBD22_07600 [Spirochaetaceae bacterium]|jgi:hypothetical protein|nr:hypothetical protein [Spirochaetaceae bacterium]
MFFFDVSKNWVILAPAVCRTAAARDIAATIALLRERAGLTAAEPPILDMEDTAPANAAEILLNCDDDSVKNSFAWRAGAERIEIYGHAPRSFDFAVFDFLAALGVDFTEYDHIRLPAAAQHGRYPLAKKSEYTHHTSSQYPILCIDARHSYNEAYKLIKWAGRTQICEIAISLKPALNEKALAKLYHLAKSYHLEVARGGFELSLLMPRYLFIIDHDLFRMEEGKRRNDVNFCASNHKTQELIKRNAEHFFSRCRGTKRFYLLNEQPHSWCSCPACRAFSFEEQNLMAVCAAASVLAGIDSEAEIFYTGKLEEGQTLRPRTNMIALESAAGSILHY